MERVLALVENAYPQQPEQPNVASPYRELVDEYALTDVVQNLLNCTPDIVESDAPPPKSDPKHIQLVQLLSSYNGCREWIRQQLLQRENAFTNLNNLSIFATTWNVNGKKPQVPLDAWLLNEKNRNFPPDIFVTGFQEVQSLSGISVMSTDETRGQAWRDAVHRCVNTIDEYDVLCAKQMIGIFLTVLVKKKHRPFVQNFAVSVAGTGLMRTGGNKGAVSCRFILYDKSFCVVTSHLAAHDHNLERRNQDYHDVVRKSIFHINSPQVSPFDYRDSATTINDSDSESKSQHDDAPDLERAESRYSSTSEPSSTIGLLEHDVVIWVGDLNYRIDELPDTKVCELIEEKNWEELGKYDQLLNAMSAGEAFQGFKELPLRFAPTYKYELFGNNYAVNEEENTLKRTPAWTDRVLWRERIKNAVRDANGDTRASSNGNHSNESSATTNGTRNTENRSNGIAKREKESPKSVLEEGTLLKAFSAAEYRRHELFSSDHRPVSVDFNVNVSIIDVPKRNRIVEGIQAELRKLHNLLRPRLSLSNTAIDIGPVEFNRYTVGDTPLVVRNMGYLPVTVEIVVPDLPVWLKIHEANDTMRSIVDPAQDVKVYFGVKVDSSMGPILSKLNFEDEKLVTCIPVHIQGKPEPFVTITAQYRPSSFGNTLVQLATHPRPFIPDVPGAIPYPARNLVIAKEIHSLVSYLLKDPADIATSVEKTGANTSTAKPREGSKLYGTCPLHTDETLFVTENLDQNAVDDVRRAVDEGRRIDHGTPANVVAQCLLDLLRSQQSPVVPYQSYDACIQLARAEQFNLEDVRVALERSNAPAPVFNSLVYLAAVVGELPVTKNDMQRVRNNTSQVEFREDAHDADRIIKVFTQVLLRPKDCELYASRDWEVRTEFVKSLVTLTCNDMLQAIFDYWRK